MDRIKSFIFASTILTGLIWLTDAHAESVVLCRTARVTVSAKSPSHKLIKGQEALFDDHGRELGDKFSPYESMGRSFTGTVVGPELSAADRKQISYELTCTETGVLITGVIDQITYLGAVRADISWRPTLELRADGKALPADIEVEWVRQSAGHRFQSWPLLLIRLCGTACYHNQ